MEIDYIRVLNPILKIENQINQDQINEAERWCIGFTLKAAIKKKIVTKIEYFPIPNTFTLYNFSRTKHTVRGEFLGWHIVNNLTLQRELKQKLNREDMKMSPSGIMNDTLIIEKIESNWNLQDWI